MTDKPISAWKIEQAMIAWASARARLLHDDPTLDGDEAALTALLGPEEGDIENIIARVARTAVHAQSMEEAAKKREDEIGARKKRYAARKDNMRGLLASLLDALGKASHEMPDMTITIGAGRQSVRITNEPAIPSLYVEEVTVRNIDKATILSVLKSGGTVDGAELSNGMPILTIRKS